jgi:hypothetical protein
MSSKRERCLALVAAIVTALEHAGVPTDDVNDVRDEGQLLAAELGE